jgi:hypothetical protein
MMLFTDPALVSVARAIRGNDLIESFEKINKLERGSTVVDLHDTSGRDLRFRALVQDGRLRWRRTANRSIWIGGKGPVLLIPRRNHSTVSLHEYWSQELGIPLPNPVLLPVPRHGEPCGILLSFQASSRHKMLTEAAVESLVVAAQAVSSNVAIVEGPGPGTFAVPGVRVIRVTEPLSVLKLARNFCTIGSVDSGIRHVLAAGNVFRIVFYGPTSPRICGSGAGEYAIQSDVTCSPCGDVRGCPLGLGPPSPCMQSRPDVGLVAAWNSIHQGLL